MTHGVVDDDDDDDDDDDESIRISTKCMTLNCQLNGLVGLGKCNRP